MIDVVLVRREEDRLSVRRERHVLHLERAGREEGGRAAIGRDGVQVGPPVPLPWEDDGVSRTPEQLLPADDLAKRPAAARARSPHLPAIAARDVRDANGPWVGSSPRRKRHHADDGPAADLRCTLYITGPQCV